MSSRKCRQAKGAVSAATTPSAPSSSSQQLEDNVGAVTGCHSPRMGRKEAEHKRRVVENQYYDELTALLSMMSERSVLKKMDKVTILKETVICVKVYYDLAQRLAETTPPQAATPAQEKPVKSPSSLSSSPPCSAATAGGGAGGGADLPPGLLDPGEMLSFFLDAHDSFLMIVSNSGRILFTSELVTSLLGQMPMRLVGQNVFDYVHPRHKSTIQNLFVVPEGAKGRPVPNSPLIGYPSQSFTAHFKLYSSETEHKSQYLPFICLSFLRQWVDPPPTSLDSSASSSEEGEPQRTCTVIIGKLPTSMAMVDLAISTNEVNFEFDMRISQKGHIIDIDKHAVMVFGFSTAELIGTLFFEYVDPYHISEVGESMSKFLSDGIGTTTPYRVRTKGGRCIWLISKGYLSYNPWNNKLNHILLANRVLGCDHVLPEHRFFESVKHLPDQRGDEAYYTPNNDAAVSRQRPTLDPDPPPPVVRLNPVSVMRPLASSVIDHTHFSSSVVDHTHNVTPNSLTVERGSTDSFPHLSTGTGGTSVLEGTLDTAFNVFSEGTGRGGVSVGNVGGGGTRPYPPPSTTTQLRRTEPPPPTNTMGRGGVAPLEGVASASGDGGQEHLQRELEEKSLNLLEMQRRLMEQEQQFNKDRMQFFRAAQKMMQQLSQGVGAVGGGEGSEPPAALPAQTYGEPNAILESMCKPPLASMVDSAAPSPMSTMSMGHGGNQGGGGVWGGVASPAGSVPSPYQQQQQQHGNMQQQQQHGNMQHHGNIIPQQQQQQQQQHGNMQLHSNSPPQQHRQVDSRSMCMNTPPSASPSFQDLNQQHSSPQQQNFAPQDYPAPPFTHSNPLYAHSPLDSNPLYRTTSQDETKFQSPLNCLPYDSHQHQSLDEHNMQFLQQQQQQQQQPRPDSLYMGNRLLMGASSGNTTPGANSSLLSSPGGGGGVEGGGGGGGATGRGREGEFPQREQNMIMEINNILSTTSSFNT